MAIDIERRQFISALGGAMVVWPRSARAQQKGKLPTIGVLGADPAVWNWWTAVFVQQLRELGWIEGRTIAIEYRWSEGRPERYAEIAAEFVRLKVDVIVTAGQHVLAVKQATSVIPIVFAAASDPVGSGYVASLARPGGNVTGLSIESPSLRASGSGCCAKCYPGSPGWRSWPMSAILATCWRWARSRRRPVRSASKLLDWKSGEPKILRPP